jgi:crossover junction endodeoxyribonuclease RusA
MLRFDGEKMTKRWLDLSESEIAERSAANRAARKVAKQECAEIVAYYKATIPAKPKPKKPARISEDAPQGRHSIILALPYPPSVNMYWRRNKGMGMHISAEGKQFRAEVIHQCCGKVGVMGRILVDVRAYPPDKRKRDLDNIFKALLDALNHARMIEDDGLIDVLKIQRGEPTKGGQVVVTIVPLK